MDKAQTDAERYARGLEIVEQVYGPGSSALMKGGEASPFVSETVAHIFGDIWSRPGLNVAESYLAFAAAVQTGAVSPDFGDAVRRHRTLDDVEAAAGGRHGGIPAARS